MKIFFSKLDHAIYTIERWLIVCALIVMVVVVFVQVALRFFALGLPWAEELTRYLMIWAGFMGASLATQKRRHLKVDLLPRLLPAESKVRACIMRLASLISAGFCFFLVWVSYDFIANTVNSGRTSSAMKFLPMWVVQLAIPITVLIMACRFVGQACGTLEQTSEVVTLLEGEEEL